MLIKEIKKKLLKWFDFYGQDIVWTDDIEACVTKQDCYDILQRHKRFLDDQNNDATSHLNNFKKELGLGC